MCGWAPGSWALASALRLFCASSLGVALTVTTRTGDVVAVLEWLLQPLRPLGVDPERLSLQLGLMLRFTEHFSSSGASWTMPTACAPGAAAAGGWSPAGRAHVANRAARGRCVVCAAWAVSFLKRKVLL